MKRSIAILGALFIAFLALPAMAQISMPSASVMWNWTGFYAGVQGGYGFGTSSQARTDLTPSLNGFSGDFSTDGGFAGITGGYNHQFGRIVFGVETDISKSWLQGSTMGVPPIFCPLGGTTANCVSKLDWLVTARPRLGYAFGQFLPFIDGGLAVGGIHESGTHGLFGGSETRPGWAAGAGLEVAFGPHWSGKIEYLHVGFAPQDNIYNVVVIPINSTMQADLVRAGINYRF
jgi:outer membrane immunogenic protein